MSAVHNQLAVLAQHSIGMLCLVLEWFAWQLPFGASWSLQCGFQYET